MDKTTRRLIEIASHINEITEQMRDYRMMIIDGVVLAFYADEIKELTEEMRILLSERLSE